MPSLGLKNGLVDRRNLVSSDYRGLRGLLREKFVLRGEVDRLGF
jgi:hypothetical protein